MPRARDPNRDKAYNLWNEHKGEITNREIANQLDIDEKKVAVWKSRDKWDDNSNVVQQKKSKTKNVVQQKDNKLKKQPVKQNTEDEEPLFVSDELNDKQRLFCIYYLKYYNATKAYQKAYGCSYTTANTEGSKHLVKPRIKAEIERIKAERTKALNLDVEAIIQKYMDIAFSDITDFVDFGQKEYEEKHIDGSPVLDENGDIVKGSYSYVGLRNAEEVDGTLITEVKKGKDGVSVKLADKMKALEMLTKFASALPEYARFKLQEEKLKAETELAQERVKLIKGQKKDTSLLEALINVRSEKE
ncbi:terminase small subunit [Niallia taxi]|uniref:terminase small subunit n=1 Tax=Niallia taxi TaxID=2499688 RepID=UPI00317F258D